MNLGKITVSTIVTTLRPLGWVRSVKNLLLTVLTPEQHFALCLLRSS
jgi:hypothetical protein